MLLTRIEPWRPGNQGQVMIGNGISRVAGGDLAIVGSGGFAREAAQAVVACTGRPGNHMSRPRIVAELSPPEERHATIVHLASTVSASSSIGPGYIVLAQVVLTAGVRVGSHVAIMPHGTLTHDNVGAQHELAPKEGH